MSAIEFFNNHQYLNLETIRKNGVRVKTPVWFAQEGDTLFVRTGANSGKVKRIRNHPQVNIAPCKANGDLLGEWVSANAHEVTDREADRKVNQLLGKKYGLMKAFMEIFSKLQGREYTLLEIHFREQPN